MNNQIDIVVLLGKLWQRRRFILIVLLISGGVGLTIGLLTPVKYLASSTFVPQTSNQETMSSLGGLASLAGINLGKSGSAKDIPPSLYPRILNSAPFLLDVLQSQVELSDSSLTYREYLLSRNEGLAVRVKKGVSKLINFVIGGFRSSSREDLNLNEKLDWQLTNADYDLIENLKDIIQIQANEKAGFVIIEVKERDRFVAAKVARFVEEALQQRIINYRIENAKTLFDFTYKQWMMKRNEFYAIQDSLAKYNDSNQNITSSYFDNSRMRLEAEYEMANTIYKELSSQKEQAALQIERETPIFLVIDPVMVPNQKSGPRKLILVIIFTLIGLIFSFSYVLFKDSLLKVKNEISRGDSN